MIDTAPPGNPVLNQQSKTTWQVCIYSALKVIFGEASSLSSWVKLYWHQPVVQLSTPAKANTSPAPGSRMPAGLRAGSARIAAKRFQRPPVTLPKALTWSCKSIKLNHLWGLNISPFWRNMSTSQSKFAHLHKHPVGYVHGQGNNAGEKMQSSWILLNRLQQTPWCLWNASLRSNRRSVDDVPLPSS